MHFYFSFKYGIVLAMDTETKQLLTESTALAKENNALLQKLVRSQKRANIYRLVYWGLIIFFSFGAYYLIQPFLGNLLNISSGGVSGTNNISDIFKNFSDKKHVQDLINSAK
jgi:hypothetical protein